MGHEFIHYRASEVRVHTGLLAVVIVAMWHVAQTLDVSPTIRGWIEGWLPEIAGFGRAHFDLGLDDLLVTNESRREFRGLIQRARDWTLGFGTDTIPDALLQDMVAGLSFRRVQTVEVVDTLDRLDSILEPHSSG